MAHIKVVEAVRQRLGQFTGCPIYLEGQYDFPATPSPFLVLQFPYSDAEQVTAGNPDANIYREEGAIRVVLHVRRKGPANQNIGQGRIWADEIATLFRGRRFGGVRTWAPTSPVSDDNNDTDTYYKLAFVIPYHFDIRA